MHLKLLIFISIAIFAISTPTAAQTKKGKGQATPATPVFVKPRTELADSLMRQYRFEEAKEVINQDIAQATAANYPTTQLRIAADKATLGQSMIEATEKIVVIDSFTVDREQMIKTISLDQNCGTILMSQQIKDMLGLKASPAGVGFLNNFGDHIIYSQTGKGGFAMLMSSNRFGDKWSTPQPLEGLVDSSAVQGFPFLLSDGTTFYFAAKDKGSVGGYDIYTTRYNSETKSYLKPENVGMPFNSPFNDYLMVFDDINQLGWFVSDRYQPADKVCVYVFIPTDSRETYGDTDEDELRMLASLHSIKLTQKGSEKDVENARQRLATARSIQNNIKGEDKFCFDVAYGVRYTNIDQFKNKDAKKLAAELVVEYHKRDQLIALLKENRLKYEGSNSVTEKKAIEPMILRQEKEFEALSLHILTLENKIRTTENIAK